MWEKQNTDDRLPFRFAMHANAGTRNATLAQNLDARYVGSYEFPARAMRRGIEQI
jgi:hypothetical protein